MAGCNKSKPGDFLHCSVRHMMSSSGLIGFLQILKSWKRKATQDWAVLGACSRLRCEGHTKRYRHADGRYFVPSSVRTTVHRLATDNKGHIVPSTLVGSNRPRVACAFGEFNLTSPSTTDVKSRVLDFTFRIQQDLDDIIYTWKEIAKHGENY